MSWRRNPYKYLYEWIQGLRDQGYDHSAILKAFETCPATTIDPNDQEQVEIASVIIRHALGKAPDSEIEKYCHPTEVLDFASFGECNEGYAFMAVTPEGEEDFYFLVEKTAIDNARSIEEVNSSLTKNKDKICRLILYKAHTQNPYGVSNMPFQVAAAKLTWRDFSKPPT